MSPQITYTIKTVPQPPYQCENDSADHIHRGALYEVSWSDEDAQSCYFIECYTGLCAWLKTIDRAALMTYI